jgi:hypothetical protein
LCGHERNPSGVPSLALKTVAITSFTIAASTVSIASITVSARSTGTITLMVSGRGGGAGENEAATMLRAT